MSLEEIMANSLQKRPRIAKSAFVASTATIIGDVTIGENTSVWFGAVLRGDVGRIEIGRFSNIQDNCVIHAGWSHEKNTTLDVAIGDYVTIAHGSVVHGATIESNVLVSMNCTIMDGVRIGSNCIVGAGAVVTQGTVIPPNSLCFGTPAKPVKPVSQEHMELIRWNAEEYHRLALGYYSKLKK